MAEESGPSPIYIWTCDCCLNPKTWHTTFETCDDCGAWSPQAREAARVESLSRIESATRKVRSVVRSQLRRILPIPPKGRSFTKHDVLIANKILDQLPRSV